MHSTDFSPSTVGSARRAPTVSRKADLKLRSEGDSGRWRWTPRQTWWSISKSKTAPTMEFGAANTVGATCTLPRSPARRAFRRQSSGMRPQGTSRSICLALNHALPVKCRRLDTGLQLGSLLDRCPADYGGIGAFFSEISGHWFAGEDALSANWSAAAKKWRLFSRGQG